MINFKHYYHVIVEGGNVFKQNPTTRIQLANIKPTVDMLSNIVGINLNRNLLGSTGKRESSGDLDIAISNQKYTKDELTAILKNWCQERNLNPKDYIARSGISVHFRTPIIGLDGEFVQTDFMFVPDIKWAKFVLANDETPPYKGMHRAVILSNLAKNINCKWSGLNGITNRETGAIVEGLNPDRVAQILLGDKRAKEGNLKTIPNIISFLYKKYNDVGIVLNILADARQTILKDGLDIATFLPQQKLTESSTAEGTRVGVQHLYSMYKPDQYSMSFENFSNLIDALQESNNVIQPGNSSISEKADGLSVKFGITPDNKFFLQGSYSGPVTNGDFTGKIKHEPTRVAFENSFNKIKKLVTPTLQRYKKDLDLNGIRIQAEWLYSPFALSRDNNPNIVYFVATDYQKDKLGTWSTFPIINVTDYQGNELSPDIKYDIVKSLTDLSNDKVKFLPLDIDVFSPIDLSQEVQAAQHEINNFKSQYPNYEEILNNPSRKREDQQEKKSLRQHIIRVLLPIQKRMHLKILKELSRLAGKLGEYEGLVIKLKGVDNKPFIFKVISPSFHKNKGRI
jgi:hypothetical protein